MLNGCLVNRHTLENGDQCFLSPTSFFSSRKRSICSVVAYNGKRVNVGAALQDLDREKRAVSFRFVRSQILSL